MEVDNKTSILLSWHTSASGTKEYYEEIKALCISSPVLIERKTSAFFDDNLIKQKHEQDILTVYEDSIIAVIETFIKLRCVPKLISKLLVSLEKCDSDTHQTVLLEHILPYEVQKKIGTTITQLPLSQVTEIWGRIHSSFTDNCIMKMKSTEDDFNKWNFFVATSTLYRIILLNSKVADYSIPIIFGKKVTKLMGQLKLSLQDLGTVILSDGHNDVLIYNFLMLAESWGELHLLLRYYSKQYSDILLNYSKQYSNEYPDIAKSHQLFDLTYIDSYLTDDDWVTIGMIVKKSGHQYCSEYLGKLVLQKMKAVLLFGNCNETEKKYLELETKYFLSSLDVHHQLVTDNFSIFIQFTDRTETVRLAEYILQRIGTENITIWCSIIQNPAVQENLNFIAGLVQSCFSETVQSLQGLLTTCKNLPSGSNHTLSVVTRNLDIYFDCVNHNLTFSLDDPVWNGLKDIADVINLAIKEENLPSPKKINTDKAVLYMSVLKYLPIQHLSLALKTLIFLKSLSIYVDIIKLGSNFKKVSILAVTLWEVIALTVDSNTPVPIMSVLPGNVFMWLVKAQVTAHKEKRFIISTLAAQAVMTNSEEVQSTFDVLSSELSRSTDTHMIDFAVILMEALNKEWKRKGVNSERKKYCTTYYTEIFHSFMKMLKHRTLENQDCDMSSVMVGYNLWLESSVEMKLMDISNYHAQLEDMINLALTILKSKDDIACIYSFNLLTTVCKNRKALTNFIPSDLFKSIWDLYYTNVHNDNIPIKNLLLVCTTEEFQLVNKDITMTLINATYNDNCPDIRNACVVFDHVLRLELTEEKNTIRSAALLRLLPILQWLIIDEVDEKKIKEMVIPLLQLQTAMISLQTKFVYTDVISTCFHSGTGVPLATIVSMSLFTETFEAVCDLLNAFIIHHTSLVLERIPVFLQGVQHLVQSLSVKGDQKHNLSNEDVSGLNNCSLQLERLCKLIKRHKKAFVRVAPYSVAFILKQFEMRTIYPTIKEQLLNTTYTMLDLCDDHGINMLQMILDEGSKEILKVVYDNYKKYYKYTGKV